MQYTTHIYSKSEVLIIFILLTTRMMILLTIDSPIIQHIHETQNNYDSLCCCSVFFAFVSCFFFVIATLTTFESLEYESNIFRIV